jgi:F-type H+-transporting ATPase subunit epsilon
MKTLKLFLATPERKLFEKDVRWVTLPVSDGEITVLPDHIPYIGSLKAGEITIHFVDDQEDYVAVSGGCVEFHENSLKVLVETAERAEEINIDRAQEAIERAKKAREQKNLNETQYAALAAKLEKEFARLRVVRKK